MPGEVTDVAPEEEASVIGQVGQAGMTGLDAIDAVLDAPQDFLYGAITGKEASEVGDGDDEITGRDFFETKGFLQRRQGHLRQLWCWSPTDLVLDPEPRSHWPNYWW